MNTTRWGWAAIVSTIVAVLVLLVPFAFLAWAPATEDRSSSQEETPSEDLTVRTGDILPEEARCASDEFIANSLPNSNLIWSDSVSTPFAAADAGTMFTEGLSENCGNPTFLMMNVEALSSIIIEDGLTIGDVNPWMGEFIAQKESGMKELSFLTKKADSGDSIFVTADFQEVAELTNTVLLRLKVAGITSENSLVNWHIPAREGMAAGVLPIATLNPLEEQDRKVLRIEYSFKVDSCPLFAVGFNTADKRFEVLQVNCAPETPPTSTTPPCVVDCQPPTKVECPPEMPYGAYPNCKDSPNRDPEQQGNNKENGGGLAPPVEGPASPPAGGTPPVTYTPPPTHVPAPAPTLTPDPAPAPTNEAPPGPPPSTCSPPPGGSCP